MRRIAVVGASLAGAKAVAALRAEGYDGNLVMVGAESHLPYDRPPLSKQYLDGSWPVDRLTVLTQRDADELQVELELGDGAQQVDLGTRTLTLESGARLPFDGLVLATGARPIRLPDDFNLEGVYYLRTLDDADAIREAMRTASSMVIVGAGFIGSELASAAVDKDTDVTIVDRSVLPMEPAIGSDAAAYIANLHVSHGIHLKLGVDLQHISRRGGHLILRFNDGTRITTDMVVVGVGSTPNTEWLENSGLELQNGVVCDRYCRTMAQDVVVAGDVGRWFDVRRGRHVREEHWTNAIEQGAYVARSLLMANADADPYSALPFFWTRLYNVRIHMIGHYAPTAQTSIISGDLASDNFVEVCHEDGRITGAIAVGKTRILAQCREMVDSNARLDVAGTHLRQLGLSDPFTPSKAATTRIL